MNRLYLFIFCAVMLILLSACDPFKAEQIRAQAEADQKMEETYQMSLNQEQERRHAEELHQLQMQTLSEANRLQVEGMQREYERQEQTAMLKREGINMMWQYGFLVATAVMVFGILIVGRQTVLEVQRVQTAFATAMITAVDIRSRLIYLDANTRQFPLIYQYSGKGRYLVTDPNTKVTVELDTRNEGDAQMIAGAIAIREAGVIAMEQRKSGAKDAASMAVIRPPVIEGTAIDVKTIARDLVHPEVERE